MNEIFEKISESLQKGSVKEVEQYVNEGLEMHLTVEDLLNEGLLKGMNIIGEKFKNNEVFVPEVLIAARAMNRGIDILKPLMIVDEENKKGKVIIGTVKGDLHDIGKTLVKIMMEGKGLDIVDLGVDVAPEKFLEVYKEEKADIIACSALLTTTMNEIITVVKLFEEAGLRNEVIIMCGGAPVTDDFCQAAGADKYTKDASSAAEYAVLACENKKGA